MFDVGFWELVMVAVVALVVVGPERLPRVARVAGLWLGRARRALSAVKAEIDRELKAEELREILRKQAQSNPLETILEDVRDPTPKLPADPTSTSATQVHAPTTAQTELPKTATRVAPAAEVGPRT
jgi:sec-independent protein translocase protein TatB